MEEIISLTKDLIRFRSMHSEPEEIKRCAGFIETYLDKHGIDYWRFDLKKWMPQVFTPKAVLNNITWNTGDVLVWIDADVETRASVDKSWIEEFENKI